MTASRTMKINHLLTMLMSIFALGFLCGSCPDYVICKNAVPDEALDFLAIAESPLSGTCVLSFEFIFLNAASLPPPGNFALAGILPALMKRSSSQPAENISTETLLRC